MNTTDLNTEIAATMDQVVQTLTTGSIILGCIGLAMIALPMLKGITLTASERRDSRFATRF